MEEALAVEVRKRINERGQANRQRQRVKERETKGDYLSGKLVIKRPSSLRASRCLQPFYRRRRAMANLEGKVALITGGAAGLGKAIAAVLLAKGCKVALLDIDEKQGTKTAAEFQQKLGKEICVFYKCDVTNEGQLEDCFKNTRSKFGALDILVNNAGIFSEDNWRKMFAINIESVYSGILLGFKYMGKDKGYNGGHIINTASIVGIYVAPPAPAYNTSKSAVVAMTRAFGSKLHFDRHGVKVNCLCPDPIDTPLWTQITDHLSSDKKVLGGTEKFKQRVQQPEDVARGVIKLLEDGQNGAALVATNAQGLRYYNFQEPTPEV